MGPPIVIVAGGQRLVALIDTGASDSSIDITIARYLHWDEDGTHQAIGIDSQGDYPRFVGEFTVPLLNETIGPPINGLPLSKHNSPWAAIIGRDVLCKFELRIDGNTGQITFVSS